MCCVFTCVGWLVDVIQRLWTFIMACLICSAVCCMLVTASMAGIAMGYNYSLAEYIDVKETNVSVFLKRGVFDDALADEMAWRRSGGGGTPGGGPSNFQDPNLPVAEINDAELSRRSGKKLDDRLLQSNDHQQFEGSLMRLTARPPAGHPSSRVSNDVDVEESSESSFAPDSLDQLKEIHTLMNMRRANENRATINYDKTPAPNRDVVQLPGGRRVFVEPYTPEKHQIYVDKQAIPFEHSTFSLNPVRFAVPDPQLGSPVNWVGPKVIPESYAKTMYTDEYDNVPSTPRSLPQPIRYRTGIQRPTMMHMPTPTVLQTIEDFSFRRQFDKGKEQNKSKNKLLMDKANLPSFRKANNLKPENQYPIVKPETDYEEEAIKGLPIRRKRLILLTTDRSYTGDVYNTIAQDRKKDGGDEISGVVAVVSENQTTNNSLNNVETTSNTSDIKETVDEKNKTNINLFTKILSMKTNVIDDDTKDQSFKAIFSNNTNDKNVGQVRENINFITKVKKFLYTVV